MSSSAAEVVSDDAWIGRVIDGRYRVRTQLGQGGMGAVYRVEHVRMGKVAAMKVLHRELASHPGAIKRFRREVEVVSRLDHPNIVQTFDCGYVDEQLYLIMEYVRGEDLSAIVWRDGPLAAPRALALAIQVCAALEEAHEHGVVHCDLKPDNILCVRRRDLEHAKVLDFGLAKLRVGTEPGEATATELLAGTPSYMSPEQVRFERVDARSDLYSLGATLYRLLTGEAAFEAGSAVEIMSRHLTDELVPPSQRAPALRLPGAVDRVVARAMARRREDRFANAAEMREALQAAFNQVTGVTPARQPSSPPAGDAADEPSSETEAERLAWEDFDAFERRVRWRRRLGTFLGAPLVLGALALGGWAARSLFLREGAAIVEREPNDRPALAALLPRAQPVSGRIGAPAADGQPDSDYYRIPAGAGPRAVTARLSGPPEVELVLELFDQYGQLVVRASAAPAGSETHLGPIAIGAGEAFVRVRPPWTAGEPAARGEGAAYRLTADWVPPRPDWELEPNDTPASANVVDGVTAVSGHLASAADEDWFRVRVPPGYRLEGRVDGLDGIDLVLLIGEERTRLDRRGAGEHESFSTVPAFEGEVFVGVGERASAGSPRADREEPYTLKLRFRPLDPAPKPASAAKRS